MKLLQPFGLPLPDAASAPVAVAVDDVVGVVGLALLVANDALCCDKLKSRRTYIKHKWAAIFFLGYTTCFKG